jgi:Janus kinase 2/BCL2-associated athanogene 2
MSIDVMEEKRDKKELCMSSTMKAYIPRDYWGAGPITKLMARYMLHPKCETYAEKLLKVYQPTMDPSRLKEEFLMKVERYFPFYFGESFSAKLEGGERVEAEDVRLLVSPPQRDLPVTVAMIRRQEDGSSTETICNISEICNIALCRDDASIEISRKNGIPLYFRLGSQGEAASLLSLLCGYYRLAEKWTFSLCTELRWPRLEELLAAKAHGPVTREWVVEKLRRKAAFKKGSFLVRQSPTEHDRMYLDYCADEGCWPEVVAILVEGAQTGTAGLEVRVGQRYRLDPAGQQPLPAALRQSWASVTELLLALRTVPSHIELAYCLHPSEYDLPPELLPCRTDNQRREDLLGAGRSAQSRDRLVIHPSSLSKLETSLQEGAFCQVWQGEWGRRGATRETVAIKQLKREFKSKSQESFMQQARRCMDWDDGSLASVKGLCLPTDSEPPVLVTEWFPLGPLSAYLAGQRGALQPVDLLEAATCLARALYWLDDRGLVHGEIRARNLMVAAHVPGTQFKVKLCEGGLEGPRREDVHWLDFEQLQEVLDASRPPATHLAPSRSGDVWSFGTTLWEIFSWGAVPLPGPGSLEAARQYLAGYRLPCPGTGLPAAVYPLMRECWEPHREARKRPQAIMRDMNQRLYKEYNSRRAHEYVTIDDTGVSTLTPSVASSADGSVERSGHQPPPSGLVPMFNEASRKLLESCRSSSGQFGSTSALLSNSQCSRSGSSLDGSLFNTNMSVVTCQTSLDWGSTPGGLYSISSIYQLDGDQVECNIDYPLGEGNFGVVYKGVRTKTDGDWEQVKGWQSCT